MRFVLAIATSFLVAACGFHLRGQTTLPFESLYVNASGGSAFATQLKRAVLAGTNARLSDSSKDAQAIFDLVSEIQEKQILSLSGAGTVREFELRYRVAFRVHDNQGHDWIPQTEIILKRDVTFNDSQVLAKESEEALLYKDMQSDAVQQVMRRLSAAKAPS
ncbi:MAG TPA: LPS assembly lipoprotein LptE [Burkholderiales bacterium]|nr:LPS assembly lipoprotein LptE [Burkholderiales bacterium]